MMLNLVHIVEAEAAVAVILVAMDLDIKHFAMHVMVQDTYKYIMCSYNCHNLKK